MVTNEMDVVVLTDNAIHLIECKTANMEDNLKAEATLAKLDAIRDMLGGIKGKAILVTNTKLSSASKRRANALDVAIIDFDSMSRLETTLMSWLGCKQPQK
jgi:phage gp45-like